MEENTISEKSLRFAVRIVKLCQHLRSDKCEYVMSKQLLRSGTGIGANIREGRYAQSTADFINKLSIALKEASETEYWLDLLYQTDYLSQVQYESIKKDCIELIKMLTAIIKTSKSANY